MDLCFFCVHIFLLGKSFDICFGFKGTIVCAQESRLRAFVCVCATQLFGFPRRIQQLTDSCWHMQPSKRPSFQVRSRV